MKRIEVKDFNITLGTKTSFRMEFTKNSQILSLRAKEMDRFEVSYIADTSFDGVELHSFDIIPEMHSFVGAQGKFLQSVEVSKGVYYHVFHSLVG